MFPLRDSQPSGTFPIVAWLIIAVNAAVYAFCVSLGDEGMTG